MAEDQEQPSPMHWSDHLALAIVAVAEVVLEGYTWTSALRQFQLRAARKYAKQWGRLRERGQVVFNSLVERRDADDKVIPGPEVRGKMVFTNKMKGRTRRLWHRPRRQDLMPGYLPGTATPRWLQ